MFVYIKAISILNFIFLKLKYISIEKDENEKKN